MSDAEVVPPEFKDAEMNGMEGARCKQLYPQCPQSILDFITS